MNTIIYIVILIISGIIAAAGIGGGSIYIMLSTLLLSMEQKQAQGYNLIMFVVVGIAATIQNILSKNFDKKIFLKLIFFVIIGCIIGIYIAYKIDEENIRNFFYIFMLFIGFYEIISSIINIVKAKNNK